MNRISEEELHDCLKEAIRQKISFDGQIIDFPADDVVSIIQEVIEYRQSEKEQKPVAWRWYEYGQHHITQHETKMRFLLEDGANIHPLYAEPVLAQQQTISDKALLAWADRHDIEKSLSDIKCAYEDAISLHLLSGDINNG